MGVFFTLCAYNLYSTHKSLIGSTIFSLDDVDNNNNGVAPASVHNNIINKNAVHDDQDVDKLFTDAPFLVVCNNIDISLRPMFDNFTVVRLLRRERPPPWNATVPRKGETEIIGCHYDSRQKLIRRECRKYESQQFSCVLSIMLLYSCMVNIVRIIHMYNRRLNDGMSLGLSGVTTN